MNICKINTFKPQVIFGEKVLTNENEQRTKAIRNRLNNLISDGIPVGNCIYKIGKPNDVNLSTKDNLFNVGISQWGNNLIITEKITEDDCKRAVITPDGDVFYTDSDNQNDLENISNNPNLCNKANVFLNKILPELLK